MTPQQKRWLIRTVAVLVAGVVAFFAWQHYGLKETETGLVSGNGRIEAVEIDVASRTAGRVKEIRVREGDFVSAGQVVALMDTEVLDAQRRQAEAQLQQAHSAVATAGSQLAQRESDKAAAQAVVALRQVELKRPPDRIWHVQRRSPTKASSPPRRWTTNGRGWKARRRP